MKKLPLILSICALVVAIAACVLSLTGRQKKADAATEEQAGEIPAGAIVYFDFDRVLEEYDLANDERNRLQTKVQNVEQELKRKQNKIERDQKAFQDKMNKGILTTSTANEQYQKLQQQAAAFQEEAAGKQQELAEEQQAMMNLLTDAVKTYVDGYNAEKGYDMIFAFQMQLNMPYPLVTATSALDITDEIIAGLNAEYAKNKENK